MVTSRRDSGGNLAAAAIGRSTASGILGIPRDFRTRVLLDGGLLAIASVLAAVLRYESPFADPQWDHIAAFVPLFVLVQLGMGLLDGLYVGRARYGSFDEVAHLTATLALTTGVTFLLNLVVLDRMVPVSIPIGTGLIGLVLTGGARYASRLLLERRRRPQGDDMTRVVVFGAGDGGAQIITAMLRNPESRYLPVALLDDDPAKVHLEISGVKVRGRAADLARIAAQCDASAVVIAAPSASAAKVRELAREAGEAGLTALTLPSVDQLLSDQVGLADIRPLTEEDLLGRRQIDLDIESIAGYLTGKRVLVTGAGGSIGSELCRQIHRFHPAALVMVDRDESALHAVQLSIDGRGQLDDPNLVVADIRDVDRILEVFEQHRPHVVFHTAALKHVPLLEMHPAEAQKTNVEGTANVLDAAQAIRVERFVNISTDKAADPISVLGATKLEAERLTARMAHRTGGTYLSVRFGNVLGSRGSVLTAFREQIANGGPVTVTHPDVTRYFMTVAEAVQLVIQAGALGGVGDVLVLDMGEPVRIVDVARRMVEQAGGGIEIVFSGLRPGEKLAEALVGRDEQPLGTSHDLVWRVLTRDGTTPAAEGSGGPPAASIARSPDGTILPEWL